MKFCQLAGSARSQAIHRRVDLPQSICETEHGGTEAQRRQWEGSELGGVQFHRAAGANAAREILMDLGRTNTVPEDDFYDE